MRFYKQIKKKTFHVHTSIGDSGGAPSSIPTSQLQRITSLRCEEGAQDGCCGWHSVGLLRVRMDTVCRF